MNLLSIDYYLYKILCKLEIYYEFSLSKVKSPDLYETTL
jgi:hypothetical protein